MVVYLWSGFFYHDALSISFLKSLNQFYYYNEVKRQSVMIVAQDNVLGHKFVLF
jgi:hypothetical protein